MFYTSVRKWGSKVLVRKITDSGSLAEEVPYRPILFIRDHSQSPNTEWVDMIHRRPVGPVKYDSIKDFQSALESLRPEGLAFGQDNIELQAIAHLFPGDITYDITKIRLARLDIEVSAEDGFPAPEFADSPVTAITLHDSIDDRYYVWTTKPWAPEASVLEKSILDKVTYNFCDSESQLLTLFIQRWSERTPHAYSGWNSDGFDMPYLVNRIEKLLGVDTVERLSPFRVVRKEIGTDHYGRTEVSVDIFGVPGVDLLRLYKKFTFKPRENYRLGTILYVELKESKISYEEEGSLRNLEKVNPQKYIDYNIKDVVGVVRLDDKRRLTELAFSLAYMAKINFDDISSPVRTWDSMIYNELLKDKVVPPIPSRHGEKVQYEGAYVKEPRPGMSEWVCSFDLASLYPSIIRQWNMCPSTLAPEKSLPYGTYVEDILSETPDSPVIVAARENPGHSFCSNGVAFRNDHQGVFPKLVERLYNERVLAKNKMLSGKKEVERLKGSGASKEEIRRAELEIGGAKTRQEAIKVLLNSLYGAAGNVWFRFFDIRIAEGITRNGRLVITWIEKFVNQFLNQVIGSDGKDYCLAIDTDSNYYTLEPLVAKFVAEPKTTEKVLKFLQGACDGIEARAIGPATVKLQTMLNCRENVMQMKREVIATRGFWTAAKNYALNVLDNEGVVYSEPEVKVTGLALVKASTPETCRIALEKAVKLILQGAGTDQVVEFIGAYRKEFFALPPEEVSSTISVSSVKASTDTDGWPLQKGPTQQARAAVTYNKLLDIHGLTNSYLPIAEGDKIKILSLKKPNIARSSHVVAFVTVFPREFGLMDALDYEQMFQRSFLTPLESMCRVLGIDTEAKVDLGGFFF